MHDLLDRLVGLCAGREAFLRLERRKILDEFKSLQNNHKHEDECLKDHQLSTQLAKKASTARGEDSEEGSFSKHWEQPNHVITFRCVPQAPQPGESVEPFDPYELLRTKPIPANVHNQQDQYLQNFTIPPIWCEEHKTSFPSLLLPAPCVLSRSNPYKIGRDHQNPGKRAADADSNEVLSTCYKDSKIIPAVTDSHRFRIQAIVGHSDTGASLRRRKTSFVCLDRLEADMRLLSIKLVRERRCRNEIVLKEPENPYRVRIEVDAASTSFGELEQARRSTTFRTGYRLQFEFPDAGRVDVYEKPRAMRSRRLNCGRMGR